ncbi:MAG: helix-turn-helix transcriptional regulator [Clostridia bacterium]|nr:helix-turn-helix transcriptional regulator [Clostridia bacterium]
MNSTRAVSNPALRRILAALEPSRPLPLRAIAEATDLSPSTVARAVAELTALGILTEDEGIDPAGRRPCRVILPAPVAVLPVLAVSEAHGEVTALDLAAHTLGTASVELDPALPPEEGMRMLCRRAMPLLRGCATATGLSVCAPVLLTDRSGTFSTEAVTDTVGLPPLVTVGYGEAVAAAVECQPVPKEAASLLHIHGADRRVTLLTRRDGESWRLSPVGMRLTRAFTRYTAEERSPDALRKGTARFLRELCEFLAIDCILAEDPSGVLPSPEEARLLLPDETVWIRREVRESEPSLSVLGAFTAGRRLLWEKILSERNR